MEQGLFYELEMSLKEDEENESVFAEYGNENECSIQVKWAVTIQLEELTTSEGSRADLSVQFKALEMEIFRVTRTWQL